MSEVRYVPPPEIPKPLGSIRVTLSMREAKMLMNALCVQTNQEVIEGARVMGRWVEEPQSSLDAGERHNLYRDILDAVKEAGGETK